MYSLNPPNDAPDYLSNDPLYKNDFLSHLMTRNRFELLMRMLHFNDNQIPNPNDKLVKIIPFLTLLKNIFSQFIQLVKKW